MLDASDTRTLLNIISMASHRSASAADDNLPHMAARWAELSASVAAHMTGIQMQLASEAEFQKTLKFAR